MKAVERTAIILVTFNHWEMTKNCLNDLYKQPRERFQIFVVDNGSNDGTQENIKRDFPDAQILSPGTNVGFGSANNRGVSLAKNGATFFDSILLLNNDTRIPEGSLEALQKDLSQFPDAVISPQLRNADGSVQKSWFSQIPHLQFFLNAFRTQKKAERYVHGKTLSVPNTPFRKAQWTNAAAWMMTVETWEKVGSFDENIFMYYEDVDWAYRAHRLGISFLIDTKTSITHLDGGSAKNALSRSLQHDSSQLYFYRKHFGIRGAVLSRAFRATRSLVRILLLLPKALSSDARTNIKIHSVLFLFSIGLFKCKH